MTDENILFVLTKPPYGTSSARESTDALLAALAFGQHVSILALRDAVFQFKAQQKPELLSQKNTGAMLAALPMYGAEHFYALTPDLEARHLQADDFVMPVKAISDSELQALIKNASVVLSY